MVKWCVKRLITSFCYQWIVHLLSMAYPFNFRVMHMERLVWAFFNLSDKWRESFGGGVFLPLPLPKMGTSIQFRWIIWEVLFIQIHLGHFIQFEFHLFPTRHDFGKKSPKFLAVVVFWYMAKLMQYYIINAFFWGFNQMRVKH